MKENCNSLSRKQSMVGNEIKSAIAYIILRDELVILSNLLNNSITIMKVLVTADLKWAKVFFLLRDETLKLKTLEAFKLCSFKIKHLVGKKLNLRRIPNLNFVYDDSMDKIEKNDNLLKLIENLKS